MSTEARHPLGRAVVHTPAGNDALAAVWRALLPGTNGESRRTNRRRPGYLHRARIRAPFAIQNFRFPSSVTEVVKVADNPAGTIRWGSDTSQVFPW